MAPSSSLCVAARDGDQHAVRRLLLLREGSSVENSEKEQALRDASENGHLAVVETLLGAGVHVDAADNDARTPLHVAARRGQESVVRCLLEAHANIEARTSKSSVTPLLAACIGGSVAVVKLLVDHGADIRATNRCDWTALHLAAQEGHVDLVHHLLKTQSLRIDARNQAGGTALHVASWYGRTSVVQVLVNAGADVDDTPENGSAPFQLACQAGNQQAALALLRAGASVDTIGAGGNSALHHACWTGQLEIVDLLIEADASLNVRNRDGNTPLHVASHYAQTQVVRRLIEARADLNIANSEGNTALLIASLLSHSAIVKLLLEAGADYNVTTTIPEAEMSQVTPLHLAAMRNELDIVSLLLSLGADREARQSDGITPLHQACRHGAVEVVDLLIKEGADVQAITPDGCTCLHMAAMSEQLTVVEMLLGCACRVDALINDEETPLDCACYSGNVPVIEALIRAGASVHPVDKTKRGPLHSAAMFGSVAAGRLLLAEGACVNVANESGETPLHLAADQGHVEFVRLLINADVNVNVTTDDGWTPLMFGCRSGHAEIVNLLRCAGAREEVTSEGSNTTLHAACFSGRLDVVRSLVEAGLDVDALTSHGASPLHEACYGGCAEVVAFLLQISKRSIDVKTKDGYTPLLIALERGKRDVAEVLLEAGATKICGTSMLQDVLNSACERGDANAAELILNKSVLPEDVVDALDVGKLLHLACASGSISLVQFLIAMGLDVNAVSDEKELQTPLHIASSRGHATIVHSLLIAGANVNAQDPNGWTPVYKAIRFRHWTTAEQLIKAGANVTDTLKNGRTLLHLECRRGEKEGVKALLDGGANANATTDKGHTPLMVACYAGHLCIVQMLLTAGANIHATANDDEVALHDACVQGHWEVVQELIECGAFYSPRSPSYDISYFDAAFDCKDVSRMLTVVWLLARHVRELDPSTVLDLMKRSYDATAVEAMSVCLKQWVIERADHSDLTVVPVEVFDLGGAAVASYLKDLSISTVALYRHKLCVIGPQEWGKTSLVRSLSSGHVALERAQDRTIGIDVVPWQFERRNASGIEERHEVTWWDFAGQDVYLAAHTVFYSRRAVFLVVVDLSAYERVLQSGESQREKIHESTMRAFVENTLLQRLRIIVARQPDASFIFVGTKADAVTSEQSLQEIKNDLTLRLHMWQDDWIVRDDQTFDGGLQRIGVVSRLADAPWLFVSCADQQSLESFSRDLQGLILSRRMGFRVPDKYAVVLKRLDERRRVASASSLADRIAALCVKELSLRLWLKSEVSSEFDDDECKQVLRIFHDLGELLWFENEAGGSLSRYVFLSPKLVIDFVRDAINHAYVESDDISAMTGLPETVRSNESVTAWLTSIRQTGRIPHALLMNMEHWRNADQDLVLAVKQLLNSVGLAYPAESQVMKWDSDLIAPAYWQTEADTSSEHRQFEPLSTLLELSPTTSAVLSEQYIEYEFVAAHLPSTLFEQLIVHSFTPGVTRITTNQFVAQTVGDESVLRISWFGGGRGPSAGHRVRVESMAVTKALSTRVLHFGCMVIERALESYPGTQPVREDVRIEQGDAVSFATIEATEWYQKKHWRIPGALNAFPRLLPTETLAPISLSLDVTNGSLPTVDWRGCYVDWSLRHPNHGEALGFRRCQLPLDDAMQPDWSSLSVSFSKVPAMPLLRDCRLEVSFLRSGWLCCLAPRSLVSGEGTFRDVVPDESFALMQGVEMSISLKQHRLVDGSGDGYMRLQFSCQAMQSKSTAAAPGLPSPAA